MLISYTLGNKTLVNLSIRSDDLGKVITTLVDKIQEAGSYSIKWDLKDGYGKPVTPGYYKKVLLMPGKSAIKQFKIG